MCNENALVWQGLVRIVAGLGHSWSQTREIVDVWRYERICGPACCLGGGLALVCARRVLPLFSATLLSEKPL